MELAKLFATVGFKVDKDGLTEFRKEMADLKVQLKEAAVQTGKLKNQLTGLTAQFKAFQKMTDTKGVTKWMDGIEKSVVHLNNIQMAVGGQAQRSTHWADAFSSSLFKLHQAITGRKNEVAEYAQAIMMLAASFERLKAATAGVSRFRQVPRSAISGGQGGYGGGREGAGRPRGGGNGYESNQYVGYWGRASGIAKSGPAAFLRPMLPTGMGLFNAVAGGYAFKELVATGREMMQMENMLKAISGDTETFNSNLKFVKQTADELGISILDMGQSYAKMFMSGKDKFGTDVLQKSFKGAQSYFRLLGMSAEKINLANKAIEQMFNKQKVSSEELKGQLGEHAAGVIQYFAQAAGTDVQGLFKMMENGQVGTDVVVKAMQAMGDFAQSSPEFQKQLQMSAAAQERFNNKMREFSKVMMESGLDELLTEMFGLLSQLVTVLTPLFKGVLLVVKGLKLLGEVIVRNKEDIKGFLMGFFGAGGLLAAFVLLRTQGLLGAISSISQFTKLLWGAISPATRLAGLLGTLVYVAQSISDYMNGEDNWVHGWALDIEYAMMLWDEFVLRVLIGWEEMKRGMNPFFDKGSFKYSSPEVQKKALDVFRGDDNTPGGKTKEQVDEMFRRFHENNTPKTPATEQKAASVMNFDINFNELPTSAKEALQRGDMRELGVGIGQGLRLGGLGVFA
jgi:tape measure domain-containing protein